MLFAITAAASLLCTVGAAPIPDDPGALLLAYETGPLAVALAQPDFDLGQTDNARAQPANARTQSVDRHDDTKDVKNSIDPSLHIPLVPRDLQDAPPHLDWDQVLLAARDIDAAGASAATESQPEDHHVNLAPRALVKRYLTEDEFEDVKSTYKSYNQHLEQYKQLQSDNVERMRVAKVRLNAAHDAWKREYYERGSVDRSTRVELDTARAQIREIDKSESSLSKVIELEKHKFEYLYAKAKVPVPEASGEASAPR